MTVLDSRDAILELVASSEVEFAKRNRKREQRLQSAIPDADLAAIQRIGTVAPVHVGVIDAAENWVTEVLRDAARAPNENEWRRLVTGPLDGQIGMSFALQWRYNFGPLFGAAGDDSQAD
jgi:hypothetical protein